MSGSVWSSWRRWGHAQGGCLLGVGGVHPPAGSSMGPSCRQALQTAWRGHSRPVMRLGPASTGREQAANPNGPGLLWEDVPKGQRQAGTAIATASSDPAT